MKCQPTFCGCVRVAIGVVCVRGVRKMNMNDMGNERYRAGALYVAGFRKKNIQSRSSVYPRDPYILGLHN